MLCSPAPPSPFALADGPLLAYWASRVDGSSPAALPMLRLLLVAGLDPLAFGVTPTHAQGRAEPVGGRIGTLSSFLLTCTHPQLLGAAVRHVLAQCAAAAPLGRSLTPAQVESSSAACCNARLGRRAHVRPRQLCLAFSCGVSCLAALPPDTACTTP